MESKNKPRSIIRFIDKVTETFEDSIMSVGLYTISIIVFVNVILRYFFNSSLTWAEELSRYILIWITFLGISSCARYGNHVTVDLLQGLLKGIWKKIHLIIIDIVTLGVSLFMTYVSIKFTRLQFLGGNVSVAIKFPSWVIYLATVLGFIMLDFVLAKRVVSAISHIKDGEEATEK